MGYPVGKVAGLAGVTVRTLHHYDEIGLLSPSGRSSAGYRSYSDAELDRLQRILFYRELGFSLEAIATIVDDPGTDAQAHLKRQRELLTGRIEQLNRMVAAVERAMEANAMGNALTPEEKFEVFGGFTGPEGYAEQAVRRWGDTPEWEAGQTAVASMSKQDWIDSDAARQEWVRRLTSMLDSGEPAASVAAMDLAEEHRAMLGRFIGECGYEMHRNIAELYVSDPVQLSFLVRESEQRQGMAEFVRDAVVANAARAR
jgi:DNA-binding transcriptional MerR regulator